MEVTPSNEETPSIPVNEEINENPVSFIEIKSNRHSFVFLTFIWFFRNHLHQQSQKAFPTMKMFLKKIVKNVFITCFSKQKSFHILWLILNWKKPIKEQRSSQKRKKNQQKCKYLEYFIIFPFCNKHFFKGDVVKQNWTKTTICLMMMKQLINIFDLMLLPHL